MMSFPRTGIACWQRKRIATATVTKQKEFDASFCVPQVVLRLQVVCRENMAAHTTSPYICWICSLASMLNTDLLGYLPTCWNKFILRKFWACDLWLTHRYGWTKHLDCRWETVPLDHSLELRKAVCSQEHPCILQPLLVSRIYRSWRRSRRCGSWVFLLPSLMWIPKGRTLEGCNTPINSWKCQDSVTSDVALSQQSLHGASQHPSYFLVHPHSFVPFCARLSSIAW